MAKHALLSASSAHRWLNCPPSAKLSATYQDTSSEFARQGTECHSPKGDKGECFGGHREICKELDSKKGQGDVPDTDHGGSF